MATVQEYGQPQHNRDVSNNAQALQLQLAAALPEKGFEVETDFGQSGLRHLAVRRTGDTDYSLAVLLDDGSHYAIEDLETRYTTSIGILRAFDWKVVQVLGKDWYQDRESVIERLIEQMK